MKTIIILITIASSTILLSSERNQIHQQYATDAITYYLEQKGHGGDLTTIVRMKLDREDRKEKAYANKKSVAELKAKQSTPQNRYSASHDHAACLTDNASQRTSKL